MTLKLERDQARAVLDNFFPYLEMLCETKYQDCMRERDTYGSMNVLLIRSLVLDLHQSFKRKLLTNSNRFTFRLTDHHAITMCSTFMQLPINSNQVWLFNLRQLIVSTLDQQIKNLTA